MNLLCFRLDVISFFLISLINDLISLINDLIILINDKNELTIIMCWVVKVTRRKWRINFNLQYADEIFVLKISKLEAYLTSCFQILIIRLYSQTFSDCKAMIYFAARQI